MDPTAYIATSNDVPLEYRKYFCRQNKSPYGECAAWKLSHRSGIHLSEHSFGHEPGILHYFSGGSKDTRRHRYHPRSSIFLADDHRKTRNKTDSDKSRSRELQHHRFLARTVLHDRNIVINDL